MSTPGMLDPNGGLPDLTDDQLKDVLGPAAVAGRRPGLQRQQQMADALRNSQMAQGHRSAIGTGLAGIGDLLNVYRGKKLGKENDAAMAALPGEEEQARIRAYHMIQSLRQPEQPLPGPVQAPQMIE